MASESNEAGGSIPHDTGSGQSSNPTPEIDLSAQTLPAADQILKHKRDREVRGSEWWGDRHPLPSPGDPDRKFVFATTSNATMTDDEVAAEVENWKKKMTNPTTGEVGPLGLHLRQGSAPVERAERARDKLIEQNIEVSDEMYKTIFEQYTQNSGLDASMLDFFRDKKEVPVEYVNELRRRIDRLKMEMGKQLAKKEWESRKLETDFGDFKKDSEEEKLKMAKEVQRLQDSLNAGNDATKATSGANIVDETTRIGYDTRQFEREIETLKDTSAFMLTDIENKKRENTGLKAEVERLKIQNGNLLEKLEVVKLDLEDKTKDKMSLEDEVKILTQGFYNVQADVLSKVPKLAGELEAMGLYAGLDNRSDGKNPLYPADSPSLNDLGGEGRTFVTLVNKLKDELDSMKAKLAACTAEKDKLKIFFHKMHFEVQTTRSGWSLFIKQVSEIPDEEQKLPTETRLLIKKMYEDWVDLERKFLTGWPGAQPSLEDGQLRRDILTNAALDKAQISLQQKLEQTLELNYALSEQEKEYATRLNRLDIIHMNDSELRQAARLSDDGLHEHSDIEHGGALSDDGNDTNPLPQAWETAFDTEANYKASENRGIEGGQGDVVW